MRCAKDCDHGCKKPDMERRLAAEIIFDHDQFKRTRLSCLGPQETEQHFWMRVEKARGKL